MPMRTLGVLPPGATAQKCGFPQKCHLAQNALNLIIAAFNLVILRVNDQIAVRNDAQTMRSVS